MNSGPSILAVILLVIVYVGLIALAFYLSYVVIHKAITRGLRNHYIWTKEQELDQLE